VHNSIPEYASTASILKPFKKNLRKRFSPQISSKPPGPQETEHKREREREREKEKRKLQWSRQIKGEVNILRGEKHFNFKNSF
jgi:hypothetical protein